MHYAVRRGRDICMLSRAVQAWFRHYGATVGDESTQVLCSAAVDLYNNGHKTAEEIASVLIDAYRGLEATRINAPTSAAIHWSHGKRKRPGRTLVPTFLDPPRQQLPVHPWSKAESDCIPAGSLLDRATIDI